LTVQQHHTLHLQEDLHQSAFIVAEAVEEAGVVDDRQVPQKLFGESRISENFMY
jgi:hypothetical protein